MKVRVLIILSIIYISECSMFFPTKYCTGVKTPGCIANVTIYANSLYSSKEFINLDYGYSGFCPTEKSDYIHNNIGQNIYGDSLNLLSAIKFEFDEDIECQSACSLDHNSETLTKIKFSIENSFQQEWVTDGLPILRCVTTKDEQRICATHFYIGCVNSKDNSSSSCELSGQIQGDYVILNHLQFDILYKDSGNNIGMIVEVTVTPKSFKSCNDRSELVTFKKDAASLHVDYTYSVRYIRNDSKIFENRFDYVYTLKESSHVKWLSISVTIFLIILLTSFCAHLFIKTVRRDISRYTEMINTGFETQDEYGWKLLKGDIFRAPKYRLLLSVTIGNGIQIVCMTLITLLFAVLGFFSPLARGSTVVCLIVSFVILGALSGFVSARIYKFFDGENWKMCVLASALLHPGIIFICLGLINIPIQLFSKGSSISFLTLFQMFALWAFVSIPLTFAGAFYGFKRRAINCPAKKNIVPRMIPRQTMFTSLPFSVVVGSFLCFVCMYVKFGLLFNSIWLRHSYIMFGLLFFTVLLLVCVCAEVSIVFCYFHLCAEDYRWQWRSFFTVACSAIYCLVAYIFEFMVSDELSALGKFVSFSYSALILYMFLLATGSVGFLSCFYVLLKMFASIKID